MLSASCPVVSRQHQGRSLQTLRGLMPLAASAQLTVPTWREAGAFAKREYACARCNFSGPCKLHPSTQSTDCRRHSMRVAPLCAAMSAAALLAVSAPTPQAQNTNELRPPSAFAGIADREARSRALFSEVAKVLTSPRCINCHPAGDRLTQGNDLHPHLPPVWRAAGACQTCHTDRNFTLMERASYRSIPGHPRWDVAPIEMAWQGKSISEICQQLKDPQRNGGRSLELLHQHLAKDDLVAWGWQPGEGRTRRPGRKRYWAPCRSWIDSGAACP